MYFQIEIYEYYNLLKKVLNLRYRLTYKIYQTGGIIKCEFFLNQLIFICFFNLILKREAKASKYNINYNLINNLKFVEFINLLNLRYLHNKNKDL